MATTPVPSPTPDSGPPPAAPAAPTTPRQEIYAKYYDASQPPQPSLPAAAAPPPAAPEPPAPVEPPEPPATADAPATSIADDLAAIIDARIAEALGHYTRPTPPAAPPAEPPADDWVKLVGEGKIAEAEKVLAGKIAPDVTTKAVMEALSAYRVETEVNDFIREFRVKNPDLEKLEDVVTVEAQRLLDLDRQAGKIQTQQDFLRQYKAAVTKAAEKARTIAQHYRAAGKQEAFTATQQVVGSSTLSPSPSEHATPAPAPAAPPSAAESYRAYMQERQARLNRDRGLAT